MVAGLALIAGDQSDLTRTGTPLGTLNYMAPEQAEGRTEDISTETDVYGLGAILYQLLTRRVPLSGDTTLETLQRIRDQDPVTPSKINPAVPHDLEAICLRCLHKDARRRYGSAHQLGQDLRRFLQGEPTDARPISTPERLWRVARKSPALTALVLVICVAVMALWAGQVIHSRQLATSLHSSRTQKQRAERALDLEAIAREDAERVLGLEKKARQRAERAELKVRTLLYVSDMQKAIEAWRDNNLPVVLDLLAAQVPRGDEADLRGFEWHLLDGECNPRPERSFRHGSHVTGCLVTPDHKTLVTCGEDGKIRLWDLASGELTAIIAAHVLAARSVAISPGGDRLVSGGDDELVHIWDLKTHKRVRTLGKMETGVETVAWSPDGRWIAAGARYSEFRVWSQEDDEHLQVDNDHRHESLAFLTRGSS